MPCGNAPEGEPGKVSWGQLGRLSTNMGFMRISSQGPKPEQVMLHGDFKCLKLPGGLSCHYGKHMELQDASTSSELPAGLSLTLLLDGDARFALGGTQHNLRDPSDEASAQCCAIVLQRPELLTRFHTKDAYVHKLNVFLDKAWFDARWHREHSKQLDGLFSRHCRVLHWKPSAALLAQAEKLVRQIESQSFEQSLAREWLTLALVEQFLKELEHCFIVAGPSPDRNNPRRKQQESRSLHVLVEQQWGAGGDLTVIARNLNMSVSTLQRRFRQEYGVTVMQYLKRRGLEKARVGLLEQGLSIGEAAYLAGYRHTGNFIVAFKRSFGLTPGQLLATRYRN